MRWPAAILQGTTSTCRIVTVFTGTATHSPTESYYVTLLHELPHWTGARHRLGRDLKNRFREKAYAMEELVAELRAAFLCADLGITNEPRPDHAAYVALDCSLWTGIGVHRSLPQAKLRRQSNMSFSLRVKARMGRWPMEADKVGRIRHLNDLLRCKGIGGKVMVTAAIDATSTAGRLRVLRAVAAFTDFNKHYDPHAERDCAELAVDGASIFWKIDYFDRSLSHQSPDPAEPSVTARIMTVMLASEYWPKHIILPHAG